VTLSEEATAKGVYFGHNRFGQLLCAGQCGDDEAAYESLVDMYGDEDCSVISPMVLDHIPEHQHEAARNVLRCYDTMEDIENAVGKP